MTAGLGIAKPVSGTNCWGEISRRLRLIYVNNQGAILPDIVMVIVVVNAVVEKKTRFLGLTSVTFFPTLTASEDKYADGNARKR
jgi:hypothetical protein